MNQKTSFGEIVKERRTDLGLTQAELARRVGCAAITIRKIEADALRPAGQVAELLAIALTIPEKEQLAFIRLVRADLGPSPIPTPAPAPEEIGQEDLSGRAIRGFHLGELIGTAEIIYEIAVAYHSDGQTYGEVAGDFGKNTHVQLFYDFLPPGQ